MHDPRLEEPMTDAALDREIEALLAVAPSAGFEARLRLAAAEPQPRRIAWQIQWAFAAAALAVVATAAAVYLATPARSSLPAGAPPEGVAGSRTMTRANPEVRPLPRPAASARARTARDVGAPDGLRHPEPTAPWDAPAFLPVASTELDLPPVVLAADERRALEMLRVLKPEQPEDAPIGARAGNEVPDLPTLVEIDVPALEIAPLAQIALLEGDRP